MNHKISIVMPVYNAELTIKVCIDSIINQTFTNWLLIIVDDGSTDESKSICEKYMSLDSRIQFICQVNAGVSVARNRGLDLVQSDLLIFMDSDDILPKNSLELLYKGKNADISFINVARFCLDNSKIEGNMTSFVDNGFFEHLTLADIIIHNDILSAGTPFAKLYKTQIIRDNNIRFDKRIKNHEDHLFFYDYLLHCNSMYLCPEIGYYWTFKQRSTSLSHLVPHHNNMLIAAEGFIKRYSNLFSHFHLTDKAYISRITTEYGVGSYRAACYALYHYRVSKSNRMFFLKEQVPVMRKLFMKYGYKPKVKRYKLLYMFLCLPIPVVFKDILLLKLWRK